MNKNKLIQLLSMLAVLVLSFGGRSAYAQSCIHPTKQVVLRDLSGNYYVYWKPAPGSMIINYKVQLQCVSPQSCFFSTIVTSANVIFMNGGYLGIHIPALPSQASMVKLSILPPNCPVEYTAAFVLTLDIITDNLDLGTASCDSDTCKLVVKKWTKLKNLTDYANLKCGGAAAPAAATTVSAIDASVDISLRKTNTGKWQMKTLDTLVCDSCYVFNFQITCSSGAVYYVQDTICFNYTGPPIDCRESGGMSENQPLSIFPNPVTDHCTVQFDLDEPARVSLVLYNSLGKMFHSFGDPEELEAGSHEIEFSAADLPPGIYIVEVRINSDVKRIKLLKF